MGRIFLVFTMLFIIFSFSLSCSSEDKEVFDIIQSLSQRQQDRINKLATEKNMTPEDYFMHEASLLNRTPEQYKVDLDLHDRATTTTDAQFEYTKKDRF